MRYFGLVCALDLAPDAANDNAPWDDFDPSILPHDAVWDDDRPLTTLQIFALIAGENIADYG